MCDEYILYSIRREFLNFFYRVCFFYFAPFWVPFFICRIREGLIRSSTECWLCKELRTRSQLMGKYPLGTWKYLYPNNALSRLRNSIIKESRKTSVVRCSNISPNMVSLSVSSSERYSPVPYTSQRRTIEGGKSFLLVRMPPVTGRWVCRFLLLRWIQAYIPGLLHRSETTPWSEMYFFPVSREFRSRGNM